MSNSRRHQLLQSDNLTSGDYAQSDGCANAKGEHDNIPQMCDGLNDIVCDRLRRGVSPSRNSESAFPASKNARSTLRSKCRRSLISYSVSSGTSTAVTVMVAKAGFSSWARLSGSVLLLDEVEAVFLRLEDGLIIIPPLLIH
ncbi:hypothetical protein [Nostoc sp. CHAB 5715]|uniref:hypothetical protein n=1 Tax=Nostoc sp. CHAB 5715 TaxID=2780400 RepID=UPI001E43B4E8|nr:hypothetical protein [Nostoc sp. CHAB 5715]MCC5625715.1 hypothetical protein [Nostoc sp. CHAB 5715]